MKKRILMLSIALCSVLVSVMAQRGYTFNAVALNVDGLPNEILGIEINPDGKEAAGATEVCGILANSGWDIVGFSEDFNFHDYLVAAPASDYYNFGTHGGKVSSTSNSTDGLGFACNKRYSMEGGTRVKWNDIYGGSGLLNVGDNGADGMIDKGFRLYTVTLATNVAVDVYVLHMDANTADSDDDYDSNGKDKNIVARESQLSQLANAIITNTGKNKRPVIVIGDTNCRYTREAVKTGFIDKINADSRFTINDAWIEHMWGGEYPQYPSESITTDQYGDQKGEVVDKIFYINTIESNLTLKSNSYLHDTKVNVSDHYPVVVNFTLTDPNGTPLTDNEKENNWTVVGGSAEKDNTLTGSKVEDGKTYYLKNVGSGTYFKSGATWGTQAAEGSAGMPITFNLLNRTSNEYSLRSTLKMHQNETEKGYVTSDNDSPYTDGQSGSWTLKPIYGDDEKGYQYQLLNSETTKKALAYVADEGHALKCVTVNETDNNQRWILLTEDDIRNQMAKATAEVPYDITPLLKAANFDKNNTENNTTNWGNGFTNCTVGGVEGGATTDYEFCAVLGNTTNEVTISQTISNLPKGNYSFTGQGFYRYEEGSKGIIGNYSYKDITMTVTLAVGDKSTNLAQNKSTAITNDATVPAKLFKEGQYPISLSPSISNGSLTIKVTKPQTNADKSNGSGFSKKYYTYRNWVCFDNFRLIYLGDGTDGGIYDPNLQFRNALADYINATAEKVKQLNTAGQAAYDITIVINRYNDDKITSQSDVDAMTAIVKKAYENAYAAHRASFIEETFKNLDSNGGDVSTLISNASFESGDLTGWTVAGGGWDVNTYPNSNATFFTNDCDGEYLFNSYGGDDGATAHIKQTITGIPNGLYELKAKVTSFKDRYVYITGNGYHNGVKAINDKTQFHEATLYFLVVDGSATIGAVGGNNGGGTEYIHYYPEQGCFFKADDFRLRYICDLPHGRLKLALDEAATNFDEYGQAALNISSYQTMYDNKSLSSDGKSEVIDIHSALQTAAKAQRTVNADMTWAITNPSFETGDLTGWSTTIGWDTKVAQQESNYMVAGTAGMWLFNTWNNQAEATNSGFNATIKQTVNGIPNGTYRLTAMLSSDSGNKLKLIANDKSTEIDASTNGHSSGVFPTVECEVTDHKLTIEAGGVNNVWYKADDFRLTYLGHHIDMDESSSTTANDWYTSVNVTRKLNAGDGGNYGNWNTFVLPFDMAIPARWEVKKLTNSTIKGETISMVFDDAETIKAGVPYMVRVSTAVSKINVENVEVTTTPNNVKTEHLEFVGVYESGHVPQGAFFISSNKFYRAAKPDNNKIKAFRAYLKPLVENSSAKTLNYSFDDDSDVTGIEEETTEATIVGVYTLDGKRIDDMQKGVNILKMSNGKTVKVIIK